MKYTAEQSEKAFIGCLILDPELLEVVKDKGLTPDWLKDGKHKRIFEILLEAFDEGKFLDPNTISDKGVDYLMITELMDSVNSTSNFDEHAYNIGVARLNEAIQNRLLRDPENPQSVRALIDSFENKFSSNKIVRVSDIAKKIAEEVINENPKIEMNLPWSNLNQLLSGIQRKKLYFVGGLPGHRKTDFVINISDHILKQGFKVLHCDYEMGESDTFKRYLTKRKEIPNTWIDTRRDKWGNVLAIEEREIMSNHTGEYGKEIDEILKIVCYRKINEIKSIAKSMQADVIVIDHIQLFCEEHPMRKGSTNATHINNLCRRLKKLAMELDVAVICPSQIDKNMEGPPRKKDFKESAGMMENGDVLIGIWWPHAEQKKKSSRGVECLMNFFEYVLAKHRGGPVGRDDLECQPDTGLMKEFSKREEPSNCYEGNGEL